MACWPASIFVNLLFWGWKTPGAPSAEGFLEQCRSDGDGDGDNTNKHEPLELAASMAEQPQALIVEGNYVQMTGSLNPNTGIRQNSSLGDFVISSKTSEVIDPLLQECPKHMLPLICVDPDFVTVNPYGTTYYMPGTIAKRYEAMDGNCVYFGKPHVSAFEEGIRRLQAKGISKDRIAMIGDSLHHDVAGANAVGLDSILLRGGAHRTELELQQLGDMVSRERLEALCREHGQTPTIVAPMLC